MRSGDKITAITAEASCGDRRRRVTRPTSAAHLNRPGTWIDFGPVATDGAVKINREKGRLVLFPYPRGKRFRVAIDLKALAPYFDPSRVKVRALAAGDARDLGPAEFRWENGRLIITMGRPGVGRYVVGEDINLPP